MIVLDAEQIKSDHAKIMADQEEIKGITADVATLHVLAQSFGKMASRTAAIENDLQAVQSEWQTLESDVTSALTEITSAMADAQSRPRRPPRPSAWGPGSVGPGVGGGGHIVDGSCYDFEAEGAVAVAVTEVVDRLYGR